MITSTKGNHAYRAYSFTGGSNLFTPLLPISRYADQAECCSGRQCLPLRQPIELQRTAVHLQGNLSRRLNLMANYTLVEGANLGLRPRRAIRLCQWRLQSASMPSARATMVPPAKMSVIVAVLAGTWHAAGRLRAQRVVPG